MVVGMGKLLEKKSSHYLPYKKGLRERRRYWEGIRVLEEHVGDMFHKLIERTHEKFDEDLECVDRNSINTHNKYVIFIPNPFINTYFLQYIFTSTTIPTLYAYNLQIMLEKIHFLYKTKATFSVAFVLSVFAMKKYALFVL